MSTLIKKDNLLKVLKYFMIGFITIIGIYLGTFLIETIFNLGVYLGTFIRGLYSLVC